MLCKIIYLCVVTAVLAETSNFRVQEGKPNPEAEVAIQATNNTSVPSVTYIADAVQCLEEAYSIYADDENRALLYAALFEEKHNGTWNVAVGYTAVYLHSSIYIEAMVLGKDLDKFSSSSDEDDDNRLFLIFSSD